MESSSRLATQPLVEYEGEVYARAGNLTPRSSQEEEFSALVGFETIDEKVEELLEKWEDQNDVGAAIDACSIISQFPEHYSPVPEQWYDDIYSRVITRIQLPTGGLTETRDLVIHSMQIPELHARLTAFILELLQSSTFQDLPTTSDHIITNYLEAYAWGERGITNKYQALYHFLRTCNSDDSAL